MFLFTPRRPLNVWMRLSRRVSSQSQKRSTSRPSSISKGSPRWPNKHHNNGSLRRAESAQISVKKQQPLQSHNNSKISACRMKRHEDEAKSRPGKRYFDCLALLILKSKPTFIIMIAVPVLREAQIGRCISCVFPGNSKPVEFAELAQ